MHICIFLFLKLYVPSDNIARHLDILKLKSNKYKNIVVS